MSFRRKPNRRVVLDRRAKSRNGRRATDHNEERELRVARIIEHFQKHKAK